jgi:hypothetical protein
MHACFRNVPADFNRRYSGYVEQDEHSWSANRLAGPAALFFVIPGTMR